MPEFVDDVDKYASRVIQLRGKKGKINTAAQVVAEFALSVSVSVRRAARVRLETNEASVRLGTIVRFGIIQFTLPLQLDCLSAFSSRPV